MVVAVLDESCVGLVISEHPFVKLLTVPKVTRRGFAECLAQVNTMLAWIEVRLTPEPAE